MSVHNPYLVAPKPPVWPWIVGAVLVLVGSVVVFVASFAASAILGQVAESREAPAVEQTVYDFDEAYRNADCAGLQRLVDEHLADQLVGDDVDCESWAAKADALWIDGEYGYSVEVLETYVDGNRASVYTEEQLGAQSRTTWATNYYYTLERSGQGWVIIGYDQR